MTRSSDFPRNARTWRCNTKPPNLLSAGLTCSIFLSKTWHALHKTCLSRARPRAPVCCLPSVGAVSLEDGVLQVPARQRLLLGHRWRLPPRPAVGVGLRPQTWTCVSSRFSGPFSSCPLPASHRCLPQCHSWKNVLTPLHRSHSCAKHVTRASEDQGRRNAEGGHGRARFSKRRSGQGRLSACLGISGSCLTLAQGLANSAFWV